MARSTSTTLVVLILLGIGIGIAALFVWRRIDATSVEGWYAVTDSFTGGGGSLLRIEYVEVPEYDTTKIVRSGAALAQQALADPAFDRSKERTLLIYFYRAQDTASLSEDAIENLAYTHRNISDPASKLFYVSSGYMIRAQFPRTSATTIENPVLSRSAFYRPRPGYSARELHGR
ncbi:MAG: hypothetical protein MUC47_02730 [Candidatus Kapabacteria bacterium]|nr:hypothetical protein [Candidatus Kapabacteria bacterium]